MAASAFIPVAVFVLVVGTIGWRLLALWRRTRQRPELLLGLGLVLTSCVAIPLAAVGRVPGLAESGVGRSCFALGMFTIAGSQALLIAFTQQVFRPGAPWAKAAGIAVTAVVTAAVAFISFVNFTGVSVAEIVPRMRPGTLTLMGSMLVCFAWASAESFAYWRALRRRLALGLADPVVGDRFYLWGLSSGANTLLLAVMLHAAATGAVVLRDPFSLTAMAAVGTLMSGAWYLTFLAPERYLDWVRRRAASAQPR